MNEIESSEIIPMTVNSLLEVLTGLKENGHGDLEIIHSHNNILNVKIIKLASGENVVWLFNVNGE